MKSFLWNLVLALVWVFATGRFTFVDLLAGYAIGFVVLVVSSRERPPVYARRVAKLVRFLGFLFQESLVSALRIAYDALTPGFRVRPAVVAVPLDTRTDEELTLLASLITLTPGSLAVDVSEDRRTLFVYAMYVKEPEEVRRLVKEGYERRVLEVFR